MEPKHSTGNAVIAAERRRRIMDILRQQGSAEVTDLANEFSVGLNTIRNDLDTLQGDGMLKRIHGGAIIEERSSPRPPYIETRSAFMTEKSKIAEAALEYIPKSGTMFIGSGSTMSQFVSKMHPESNYHVVTNSLEIAAYLVSEDIAHVDFLGGSITKDALASNGSLAEEALDDLYWEVTFMGAAAVDTQRGITTLDWNSAKWERRLMNHSGKLVVLCDSSKLGKFSYGRVGPVTLIDVLITDNGADKIFVEETKALGIEVILV